MVGGCDVKKYAEYKNINFKTAEEGKQQKWRQDIKKICFDATSLGLGPFKCQPIYVGFLSVCKSIFSNYDMCYLWFNLNALSLVYLILGIVAAAKLQLCIHATNDHMASNFMSFVYLYMCKGGISNAIAPG